MYVDPATVEPVTELPTAVAEVVADRVPAASHRPRHDAAPAVPAELRVLVRDARDVDDATARRSLAFALLDRGWTVATAGAASGLGEPEVSALDHVQRPGTAASSVADDLVAARLEAHTG